MTKDKHDAAAPKDAEAETTPKAGAHPAHHTAGIQTPLTGADYDAVIAALAGDGPLPENFWIDWSQPNPIRTAL